MSEIADNNIKRYTLDRYPLVGEEPRGRFCLLSLIGYESDDPVVNAKRDRLIELLGDEFSRTVQTLECTIGGCDVAVTTDIANGTKETTGTCTAASYCIKEAFEAVKGDDGVEAGRRRYRQLMDTCEGFAGRYSAGNFCPKLECGLSAGVSIDMVPGTSGECFVEIRSSQGQLFE